MERDSWLEITYIEYLSGDLQKWAGIDRSSCIFPSFCAAFLPAISQRAANKATLQIVSSYNLQTTNRLLGGKANEWRRRRRWSWSWVFPDVRVEAQFLFALRQLLCCCRWLVWFWMRLQLQQNRNQKQSTDSRVFLGRVCFLDFHTPNKYLYPTPTGSPNRDTFLTNSKQIALAVG